MDINSDTRLFHRFTGEEYEIYSIRKTPMKTLRVQVRALDNSHMTEVGADELKRMFSFNTPEKLEFQIPHRGDMFCDLSRGGRLLEFQYVKHGRFFFTVEGKKEIYGLSTKKNLLALIPLTKLREKANELQTLGERVTPFCTPGSFLKLDNKDSVKLLYVSPAGRYIVEDLLTGKEQTVLTKAERRLRFMTDAELTRVLAERASLPSYVFSRELGLSSKEVADGWHTSPPVNGRNAEEMPKPKPEIPVSALLKAMDEVATKFYVSGRTRDATLIKSILEELEDFSIEPQEE